MLELKPNLSPREFDKLQESMPRIDQALYHAGQAEIQDQTVVSMISQRATYFWLTSRYADAISEFDRAASMSASVFGTGHTATIGLEARREAVRQELAQRN